MIRELLIVKMEEKNKSQNRGDNKNQDAVNYLMEKAFKKHFTDIINSALKEQAELKKEKTRTLTSWKNREDNYEKMIDSTREIYVDIRRMLGDASLHIPEIDE